MKVNNLSNLNNIKYINNYTKNNQKTNDDKNLYNKDKCEISSIGKVLNTLSIEDITIDFNFEKDIKSLKERIASGNYKVDSKALAESIVNTMKGRA